MEGFSLPLSVDMGGRWSHELCNPVRCFRAASKVCTIVYGWKKKEREQKKKEGEEKKLSPLCVERTQQESDFAITSACRWSKLGSSDLHTLAHWTVSLCSLLIEAHTRVSVCLRATSGRASRSNSNARLLPLMMKADVRLAHEYWCGGSLFHRRNRRKQDGCPLGFV